MYETYSAMRNVRNGETVTKLILTPVFRPLRITRERNLYQSYFYLKTEIQRFRNKEIYPRLNEYSKIHSKDNLINARLRCILFQIVHSNEPITRTPTRTPAKQEPGLLLVQQSN